VKHLPSFVFGDAIVRAAIGFCIVGQFSLRRLWVFLLVLFWVLFIFGKG